MNHFSCAFYACIMSFIFATGSLVAPRTSYAKVDPPNYDFSLDRLEPFMPGKSLKESLKKQTEVEVIRKEKGYEVRKIYIEHIRYKFPLLIQSKDGVITDFYARLPAYFLHNIFHQSLINRLGDQDIYKKLEEQAVYAWKNKKGNNHVYSGACTITCFPVYYTVFKVEKAPKGFVPLVKIMSAQESGTL